MVRKLSGPITSTTCPMARNSSATVDSVRTTPLTCGRHASVTIMMRWLGAGGSIASGSTAMNGAGMSGRSRQPDLARCEEGQPVQCGPVDQLQPAVMVLDERGAAFDPVAVIEIQHTLHLAHFGMMDVAADHPVEAAPT